MLLLTESVADHTAEANRDSMPNTVCYTVENGVTVVRIHDEVRAKPMCRYAWVVRW